MSSDIEIVAMRPFTTFDVDGKEVYRTMVTYRQEGEDLKSRILNGTIRDVQVAAAHIREA